MHTSNSELILNLFDCSSHPYQFSVVCTIRLIRPKQVNISMSLVKRLDPQDQSGTRRSHTVRSRWWVFKFVLLLVDSNQKTDTSRVKSRAVNIQFMRLRCDDLDKTIFTVVLFSKMDAVTCEQLAHTNCIGDPVSDSHWVCQCCTSDSTSNTA